jgi:hypothetical protein
LPGIGVSHVLSTCKVAFSVACADAGGILNFFRSPIVAARYTTTVGLSFHGRQRRALRLINNDGPFVGSTGFRALKSVSIGFWQEVQCDSPTLMITSA